jgi:putative peptidoglycan lipid II flippase
LVGFLASGFEAERLTLAVDLSRITFPYLIFMSMVILLSAMLNAFKKYAAAAAAPIFLNISMIICLLFAASFQTAGHAAAYGITISGVLQFLLLAFAALKVGAMVELRIPRVNDDVKTFWKRFIPAVLGSSGVAISLLADTMIASHLNTGIVSVLNAADRINQLPLGVIGIAVGTVLLSEMSSKIANGDEKGARYAQLRAIELTFLCTLPFLIAFTMIPEIIMKAVFVRGKFTEQDALEAASALAAYGLGLTAVMLIRSAVVTFQARGDTKTPLIAMVIATLINIVVKIALIAPFAQAGIAFATSLGAWINWGLLIFFAKQRGLFALDDRARDTLLKVSFAGLILAFTLIGVDLFFLKVMGVTLPSIIRLVLLMVVGGVSYLSALYFLLGKQFLRDFKAIRAGKL